MKPIRDAHTLSVTDARKMFKGLTEDPTAEILLTRDGEPVGVYVGIKAWRAMQAMLGLLDNPEALADSLAAHRRFQKTGDAEGVSLEELETRLHQGRADAAPV
jgi:PHD/YefM family antitoxin component YafN of YafNO toxin-antitoxin module